MGEHKFSVDIANAINDFLVDDDWNFSYDEDRGAFKFELTLKSKLKQISFHIFAGVNDFTIYAVSPIGADAENNAAMAAISEFVNRANYGMRLGNFEFDFRDGEIRYKVFATCDDGIPSYETLKRCLYCVIGTFKRYGDGILAVIFGGMSPADAIDMCENENRSTSVKAEEPQVRIDDVVAKLFSQYKTEKDKERECEDEDGEDSKDEDSEGEDSEDED